MSVLVGKKAPDFQATAVVEGKKFDESFTLSQFKGKKHVVLFFYPLDFTYVCPTEMHAFQEQLQEFQDREVEVIAVSTDSAHSHLAWLNTPKSKGGIEGISYPIVADFTKTISRDYDMLIEDQGVALRGAFVIDRAGIVQAEIVNNLSYGRNVDEILRLVDAVQFNEEHGDVCPAGWEKGGKAMNPSTEGLENYFS